MVPPLVVPPLVVDVLVEVVEEVVVLVLVPVDVVLVLVPVDDVVLLVEELVLVAELLVVEAVVPLVTALLLEPLPVVTPLEELEPCVGFACVAHAPRTTRHEIDKSFRKAESILVSDGLSRRSRLSCDWLYLLAHATRSSITAFDTCSTSAVPTGVKRCCSPG